MKRYQPDTQLDFGDVIPVMDECDWGHYVKWDDHQERVAQLETALKEALESGARVSVYKLEQGIFEVNDGGCGCCAGETVSGRDVPVAVYQTWFDVFKDDLDKRYIR